MPVAFTSISPGDVPENPKLVMSKPDAGFRNWFPFTLHRFDPPEDKERTAFLPEEDVTARFCKKLLP